MASDSHEVPTPCHTVAQNSEMPVVHIGPIKLNHTTQLFQQCVPSSFNAQDINGLNDVVAGGPGVVNSRHAHHLQQPCCMSTTKQVTYSWEFISLTCTEACALAA